MMMAARSRARGFEHEAGAGITGIFHPRGVAGIEQQASAQVDRLLNAAQHDDVIRRASNAARIRDEGTRNLVAAAIAAGSSKMIAQSIAWAYRPGATPHDESRALGWCPDSRSAARVFIADTNCGPLVLPPD
ncbi:hypothetical protein [Paraburkholderia sp. BL18I3N2]|uniref:hypothetical protein n=1 Tax=Paraburkholderia sp. BL18I3N2 TaxID=1938799 RepID=UPI0035BE96ED